MRVTLAPDARLPGATYTIRGRLYSASAHAGTVALLLHGLGSASWVWDLPNPAGPSGPDTYSTARFLAARGVDVVTVDQLGYGSSDHPHGVASRELTVPAYANMAHQMIGALARHYLRVVLIGHSAGGEIAEYEAGRYRDVAALGVLDYCDGPPTAAAGRIITEQGVLEGNRSYIYFGQTVAGRDRLMYARADADPRVIAEDNRLADLTPEAELQSAGLELSRQLAPTIRVPVFLGFGTKDAIFGKPCQQGQPTLFAASRSFTNVRVSGAGHAIMLHRNAGVYEQALLRWVDSID
jgi:pimeloyl-ACP methyl ester carboxylesterase